MCTPLKLLDAAYPDQTGRIELRGLTPGRCSLTVHKKGYAAGLPYTDGPFEGLVITLPTAATFVGKIEPVTGSSRHGLVGKRASVHQKDVEPPVVVEIQEQAA